MRLKHLNSRRRLGMLVLLVTLLVMAVVVDVSADPQTGTVLAQFVPGEPCVTGNGRGMAFDGTNLYYTIATVLPGDLNIYKVDTAGNCLGAISVSQEEGPIQGGPLAWDGSALWTMNYGQNSFTLYRVKTADGSILSSCNIAAQNPTHPAVTSSPNNLGNFPDGLDWSGSTLWVSQEIVPIPTWVVEVDTSCNILTAFNPALKSDAGGTYYGPSGITFDGINLWHAYPTHGLVVQTDVSGGETGLSFTGLLHEDLACDGLTFAPKAALWANTAASVSNTITAYEIPQCKKFIDIKPGSDPNSINCDNDREVIAVAILTTDDFDALTVDHNTVIFEGASETHVNRESGEPLRHEEDVDGDGDIDLVFHFRQGATILDCESTEGTLTGETFSGQAIKGTDSVSMVSGS